MLRSSLLSKTFLRVEPMAKRAVAKSAGNAAALTVPVSGLNPAEPSERQVSTDLPGNLDILNGEAELILRLIEDCIPDIFSQDR